MAIDDLYSGSTHHHYDFHRNPEEITQVGKVAMAMIALFTFVFAVFVSCKMLNEERAVHSRRQNPLPSYLEKRTH